MDTPTLFDKLLQPISVITLPGNVYSKLKAAGISLIVDLVETPSGELSLINGINYLNIYEIELRLDELGLSNNFIFSRPTFYTYAEEKGFLFSDLFKAGHIKVDPQFIPKIKKVRFDDLTVCTRAKRAIRQTGAIKVGEVLALKKTDLFAIKNCGAETCSEIISVIENIFTNPQPIYETIKTQNHGSLLASIPSVIDPNICPVQFNLRYFFV